MCWSVLFSFVFSENPQLSGQWAHGIYALAVAVEIGIAHVDIEKVFPFSSNDGERLNLCQTEVIETKDAQHLAQTAFSMRQRKDDGGFGGAVNIPQRLSGPSITEHEETGVVVLVVLYGAFQNF